MRDHRDNTEAVAIVRSFVNTYEVDGEADRIATPDQLVRWLLDADLLAPGDVDRGGVSARAGDVVLAHELRTALRDLLRRPPTFGEAAFDQVAQRLPLRVAVDPRRPGGQPHLAPAVEGVRSGLARVVAAAVALPADEWARLKVCPAEDCQWVFYDESRNRSRRWCSMEGCGNRQKVRAYRERSR